MKKSLVLLTLGFSVTVAAFAQQAAKNDFDGKTWWDYVKVLADDNMEGRETGSAGLKRAEAYVVEQLKADGVEPAGNDGYYQPVKFEVRQIVEKDSSIALIRDGKSEPLTLGEDAFFNTRVNLAPEIEAPLVFVGYGLTIPEKNYDDLAGLDLKGKVAVIFSGSPAEMPGALASHYQSAGERWKSLRKAGVIGVVSLPNPASMDIPWSRMALNRAHPSMELADASLNETEGEKLSMIVNPASAEKFFAGSGHTFAEIAALGKDRKPLPRFPLAVSIKAVTKVEKSEVESANVIGKLPGSDPALKNEYVVLSAHIDHLGIGEPINGDKIYNGAMDNGSGSALLLDVARSLKAGSRGAQALDSLRLCVRRRERPARLEIFRRAFHGSREINRRRYQHGHVSAAHPAQTSHRLRPAGIRSRRYRPRSGRGAGSESAGRSRASAQCLHPQRSVQLHPPRHSGGRDEGRLRARLGGREAL